METKKHVADVESRRRPIKSRQTDWAHGIARWLTTHHVPPNRISVSSMAFAAVAAASLASLRYIDGTAGQVILLLAGAAGILLRLLANLFDGMVAVEGGQKTPTGELYNETPDRISDVLILLGAAWGIGCFPWAIHLGWLAGLLAVMTAWVRTMGVSAGASMIFIGPMSKSQRMGTLIAACLAGVVEVLLTGRADISLLVGLILIAAGSLFTCIRRLRRIARELNHA